jgi:D-3-phosphoglycerate dehydrogenase / 2-oxoglutarate reductase
MSERLVLVTDHPWPSVEGEIEVLGTVDARPVFAASGEERELMELVHDADAILTCFALVTDRVVRAAPRLQVIGRYGVGVDNIAVEEATNRDILVTNVPSYCEHEVAEHALALLLALARRLRTYDDGVRVGDWSLARGEPIHRIDGSTLGIVGFGRIGRMLATKAQALGIAVVVHQPRLPEDEVRAVGVEPVSLDELARRSDYVSLHVPLSDETRHLVGRRFLRAMKPTAFLVNTARGAIVDPDALLEALRERSIAGAALDVFEPEQLPADDPLLALPNLIATPHVAYYSEESLVELGRRAAENVAAVLDGRRPAAVVNPEVLASDRWRHLRPAAPRS